MKTRPLRVVAGFPFVPVSPSQFLISLYPMLSPLTVLGITAVIIDLNSSDGEEEEPNPLPLVPNPAPRPELSL